MKGTIFMSRLPDVTEEEWLACDSFNRKIVEEFLSQKHLSEQTLLQYKSALRVFTRWVKDECDNKKFVLLKNRHALAYQNYLIDAGLSNKAVKFKRSVVSSMYGFIETYYDDEYPELRNIYNKKIPSPGTEAKREKRPLNSEEFNMLLNELEKRGETQILAYLQFSFVSGCRRAEARQLLKEVVSYEKVKGKNYYNTHLIRCKGRGREGKQRRLILDDVAMNAIKKWLDVRSNGNEDNCPYVFVTKNENGEYVQISPNTFNYWCTKILSPILGRRLHPHALRTSRASILSIEEGKDIKSIQALLGHLSSQTTEIYIVKENADEIDDLF